MTMPLSRRQHGNAILEFALVATLFITLLTSVAELGLMFWATVIFMPLIVFYTGWAYHVMRGKITVEQIQANEHTAY